MHPALLRLLALCATIHVLRAQTPGAQLWASDIEPIAAPAVSPGGQLIVLTANAVVAVNRDGSEAWRVAFGAGTPTIRPIFPSPPVIDDAGNIYVIGQTELLALSPSGARRWTHPLRIPAGGYVSVTSGGHVLLKNYTSRVAFTGGGQQLWTLDEPLPQFMTQDFPLPSESPIVVAADGALRNVVSTGNADIRAVDRTLLVRETSEAPPLGGLSAAKLLGLGLNSESIIASGPIGNVFEVRWTRPDGTGVASSQQIPRINNSPDESLGYGLCGPTGEVFLATSAGTVAVPHEGVGYRRWPETAFAITAAGDVLCWNRTLLLARGRDHGVKWSVPASGTFFTLGADGRVYGGARLSAYHIGEGPAPGPWPLPRADPAHRARALGPTTAAIPAPQYDAPATVTFYESYEGVIAPRVYAAGPATLRWEKDGGDFAAADASGNLNIRVVSPAHAGRYRLRVQNSQGVTYSPEVRVTVTPPAPARAGLYTGSFSADGRTPFLLEITAERQVRLVTADGLAYGHDIRQRLDPAGVYPNGFSAGFRLDADATSVTFTSNGAAQRLAVAPAVLPSGARVGWYFGKPLGLVVDFADAVFALMPSGAAVGSIRGSRFEVEDSTSRTRSIARLALDPGMLRPGATVETRSLQSGASTRGAVQFDFDRAGRARLTLAVDNQREDFYAAMPDVAPGRVANLSARGVAGDAERALTGGFVVETRGTFLVRGIGPALAGFGVPAVLTAPALELRRSSGELLAANRGWSTSTNVVGINAATQLTGAFPLPERSADSAVVATLEAGAYTASVTGRPDGNALLEIYAVTNAGVDVARTVNISTLTQLGPTSPRVIVGLVVQADLAQPVLFRGVGPGLRTFLGATAAVAQNPRLRVYDAQGVLFAGNNDWTAAWEPSTSGATNAARSQTAAINVAASECGAFPLAAPSTDAALLLALPSGAYTVHLETEDGGAGAALFEAYAMPARR